MPVFWMDPSQRVGPTDPALGLSLELSMEHTILQMFLSLTTPSYRAAIIARIVLYHRSKE